MGRFGPGAARFNAARARKKVKRLPWEQKGLLREERVIRFLEWLPITKGPLTGKRMRLLPGQLQFVERVYGVSDKSGRRLCRIGIKSEPKGNGKTGLVAGLCLAHLFGPEAEPRGEVYSAAIDRAQAALIFAEMEAMIYARPNFADLCTISRFHKKIEIIAGPFAGSIYEALSNDARRAHGLSPTLFAFDELAQVKDRVLLDNLINGLGKRREALGLIISTQAPDSEHPLSQLIDDGVTGADPTTFVQLTAAPDDADPFDEATWKACNPALGKFLSLDEMRTAADRARRLPAFEPGFRNLRLNQRIDAREEERICTPIVWKANGTQPTPREQLRGRKCFAGLDLSAKHDLTSLTLVFPSDDDEPIYDVLPFFWTPEGQLEVRRPAERDRFKLWIDKGLIEPVPGPVIRYGFIARRLIELADEFDIAVIAYDAWRIDDLKQDLADADPYFNVPLEAFGQGFKPMAPAISFFAELALTERLRHGMHPVLTAAVASAVVVRDSSDNLKIDKVASRGPVRIDGAVTLCMALEMAKRAPDKVNELAMIA
jgi:phage terminase large subunit-like protein